MNKKWFFETELALKAISTSVELIEKKRMEGLVPRIKESPRDLVTELDLLIEKHITRVLNISGYQIIGEETTKNKNLNIDTQKPIWLIDPIDGTTNLISSIPFYATSIGLLANSKFAIGAVVMPAQKEVFFTMGNQGSFVNGKALKKIRPTDLKKSLIVAGFSGKIYNGAKRKQEYDFFGILNDRSRGCLRLGSAATNICYVAAGRLQAAYGICNKIWDVAGALAITRQARCKVYIEWIKGTNCINYVAGASGVTDKIAEMLAENKLADLKLIA